MKKYILLITIFSLSLLLRGQDIIHLEYFIDTDPGIGMATNVDNFNPGDSNLLFGITENLSPGFHNIGIRSKDEYHSWSQTNYMSVLVLEDTIHNPVNKIEYFWLSDPGFDDLAAQDTVLAQPQVNIINGKVVVDVPPDLETGNNTLFIRSRDSLTGWSHTQLVGELFVCSSSFLTYITDTAWCSYESPSGQIYTESGVYRDFVSTPFECDSSYLITLTINSVDTSVYVIDHTLFANDTTAEAYQWIDCDNNYIPVPGATEYTFTPEQSGSYALVITDNNCTDTSACYQVGFVDVADVRDNNIRIFPNPTSGYLTIELADFQNSKIYILNGLGQTIYEDESIDSDRLELSLKQPAGVYYLRLEKKDKVLVRRLIIK